MRAIATDATFVLLRCAVSAFLDGLRAGRLAAAASARQGSLEDLLVSLGGRPHSGNGNYPGRGAE